MPVLYYCDFNGNHTNQVDSETGSVGGGYTVLASDYVTFANGYKGLEFTSGACERIKYSLSAPSSMYVSFGCKVRMTTAFTGAASRMLLHYADASDYTNKELKVGLDSGGNYLYAICDKADTKQLTASTFLIGADEELTIGCQYMPDPDDEEGSVHIWRLYVNGYCIRTGEVDSTSDFSLFDQLNVGATAGSINSIAEAALRDVWLMEGERLQDYQFLRIHRDGFDTNAISDDTIYRDQYKVAGYSRAVLDYPVCDSYNNRLWGTDDSELVYYTDDETGASGWTVFGAEPASGNNVLGVFAAGDYVFASTVGKLWRSDATTPGWVENLALGAGQAILAGNRGWTRHVDGAGTRHLVIGEYDSDGDGSRILHSSDDGDNWSAVYTSGTGTGENLHIHGVSYADSGRLWAVRGDNPDNVGYSDDHGTNWTWLLDENNHVGSQQLYHVETSTRMIAGSDSVTTGALAVAFPKDLSTYQGYLSDNGWSNSWYYCGQCGGDKFGGPGWALAVLPNDFVLVFAWDHNIAGRHGAVYLMDRSGTVCLLAEDDGLPADQTISKKIHCAVVGDERVFIGNSAFPLDMSIVGGRLYTYDMHFMIPLKRKYCLPV